MIDVLAEDKPQVPFAGDQHPVQVSVLASSQGISRCPPAPGGMQEAVGRVSTGPLMTSFSDDSSGWLKVYRCPS